MSDFVVKRDEYSIRVTSPSLPIFLIRLDFMKSNSNRYVFSDFTHYGIEHVASDGFSALLDVVGVPVMELNVIVNDIYPNPMINKERLVERHDRLVKLITECLFERGFRRVNSSLFPQDDGEKFSTVVDLVRGVSKVLL